MLTVRDRSPGTFSSLVEAQGKCSGKESSLSLNSGDVKGDEVKRELTKINNLNEKNKLNNLNNTFQQISKLLTNLEAKNQLVMKGTVLDLGLWDSAKL